MLRSPVAGASLGAVLSADAPLLLAAAVGRRAPAAGCAPLPFLQDADGFVEKADLIARVKEVAAQGPEGEAPAGYVFDPATGYFLNAGEAALLAGSLCCTAVMSQAWASLPGLDLIGLGGGTPMCALSVPAPRSLVLRHSRQLTFFTELH